MAEHGSGYAGAGTQRAEHHPISADGRVPLAGWTAAGAWRRGLSRAGGVLRPGFSGVQPEPRGVGRVDAVAGDWYRERRGQANATILGEAASIETPGAKRLADALFLTGRWWNIGLRTGHIAAMGVLVGGHAFDVQPGRLALALAATLLSGVALALSEAGPHLLWFHQLRGLLTLAKLVLIAMIPLFWTHRFAILLVVVAIASIGSHMPGRFRYYSVLRREVVRGDCGPGATECGDSGVARP